MLRQLPFSVRLLLKALAINLYKRFFTVTQCLANNGVELVLEYPRNKIPDCGAPTGGEKRKGKLNEHL